MESLFVATHSELAQRRDVIARILDCIEQGVVIRMPAAPEFNAGHTEYSGSVSDFHYLFEGEEDLLHIIVTRSNGAELSPEEGQAVVAFVLEGLPLSLVQFKPGTMSQNFYLGHDFLLQYLRP